MSETFQVTARKWRPMQFADVVGQDHVTRTLKNAIRENRLAHAYLFTGQRGCGKTTVARILAKAINCPNARENDFEPCNKCSICLSITEGRSMDVSEIDGASNNGVDDVRSLRENVKYPPLEGTHKVIIIDEVHMLSTSAFNALLKTLEEPPQHLVFIFATTEVQKVLPTILSRTQRYDFRRIQLDEITGRLRHIAATDSIAIEDEALLIIAKKADGSMRDAQSIFDQVVAYCGVAVDTQHVREALNLIDADFFFEVSSAVIAADAAKAFELANQIVTRGYDIEELLIGLIEHFRNYLTAIVTKKTSLIEMSRSHQERYMAEASSFTESDVLRLIRIGQTGLERLRTSQQPRITLETTLVEMTIFERALDIQTLIGEIRSLKNLPVSNTARASQQESTNNPAAVAATRASTPPRTVARLAAERSNDSPSSNRSESKIGTDAAAKNTINASEGNVDPLNAEDVTSQWQPFIQYVKDHSRSLSAFLSGVELCGVRKNAIFIGAENKSERDAIGQYRDALIKSGREFFHHPHITFEIGEPAEMRSRAGVPILSMNQTSKENGDSSTRPATEQKEKLSEIEEALLAMGAQEV